MRTFKVETFRGESSYTVTLDKSGVVSADGLLESDVEMLKYTVKRYMKNGFSPAAALGKYVGSYSTVTDLGDTPVVP